MPLHYHLTNDNADLDPGADNWTKYLSDDPSPGAIVTTIATGATEHDYAFTVAGAADFLQGISYSVNVSVLTGDPDVTLAITPHRVNNAGTIQESGTKSDTQVADTAELIYDFEGLDLGQFAYQDRLRLDFEWVNNDAMAPHNVTITIGADTTRAFTPWLPLVFEEASASAVLVETALAASAVTATLAGTITPAIPELDASI